MLAKDNQSSFQEYLQATFWGDRQILEKPIPEIIENGEVRAIVEKK